MILLKRTEDEVRDSAKILLGFDKTEKDIKQGTGQTTTLMKKLRNKYLITTKRA